MGKHARSTDGSMSTWGTLGHFVNVELGGKLKRVVDAAKLHDGSVPAEFFLLTRTLDTKVVCISGTD